MTPERAIFLIGTATGYLGTANTIDAGQIAITAIERLMIAKKPIKDKEQHIRYISTYSCPSCSGVFSGTGVVKHCYHCGQLIDWSDTECI